MTAPVSEPWALGVEQSPIIESWDPSWPFTFKWGWQASSGRTDIWKTTGIDGRRKPGGPPEAHREVLKDKWGEEPMSSAGDVLGLAAYTPAQMKMDGSVVAPAEVKIHSYWNQPTPPAISEAFEEMFPGSVVRNARLARVVHVADEFDDDWALGISSGDDIATKGADSDPAYGDESEPTVKWIWNKHDGIEIWPYEFGDGGLTHTEKIEQVWGRPRNAGDVYGYAVVNPFNEVEIERTGGSHNEHALHAIRHELRKLFPDSRVLEPDQVGESYNSTVDELLRPTAAAKWAMDYLGDGRGRINDMIIDGKPVRSELLFPELEPLRVALEGHRSASPAILDDSGTETPPLLVRGLHRVMGLPPVSAGSGADHEGAMVAVFIPKSVGEQLYQKGGEPVKDMHITLAYFVDKAADRDDWDEVERIVAQIAKQHPKLTGKINGYGVFSNDVDVLWAAPSVPGLAELRHEVLEAVEDAGFKVSDDYGWTPHITLKYDHKGKLPKGKGSIELELGGITFTKADNPSDFEFTGEFVKETMIIPTMIPVAGLWGGHTYEPWLSAAYQPTWEGPHQFVTDGKEIVMEPETNFGVNHDSQHPALRGKFREFNPEHEGAASGWVLPTTDGLGYGIYSPTGGWGTENEPQIHEIINKLDQHLGKPTHWINEYKDALNGELYQQTEEDPDGSVLSQ